MPARKAFSDYLNEENDAKHDSQYATAEYVDDDIEIVSGRLAKLHLLSAIALNLFLSVRSKKMAPIVAYSCVKWPTASLADSRSILRSVICPSFVAKCSIKSLTNNSLIKNSVILHSILTLVIDLNSLFFSSLLFCTPYCLKPCVPQSALTTESGVFAPNVLSSLLRR